MREQDVEIASQEEPHSMILKPPLPPTALEMHERARRLWHFVLVTPILYLVLARVFVALGWVETFPQARHPWDTPLSRSLLGALAVAVFAAIVWTRLRLRALVRNWATEDPAQAVRRWTFSFYLMATLADSLSFLGLVYFSLSGKMWALLAGGTLTYIGYAIAYPSRRDLAATTFRGDDGRRRV